MDKQMGGQMKKKATLFPDVEHIAGAFRGIELPHTVGSDSLLPV